MKEVLRWAICFSALLTLSNQGHADGTIPFKGQAGVKEFSLDLDDRVAGQSFHFINTSSSQVVASDTEMAPNCYTPARGTMQLGQNRLRVRKACADGRAITLHGRNSSNQRVIFRGQLRRQGGSWRWSQTTLKVAASTYRIQQLRQR